MATRTARSSNLNRQVRVLVIAAFLVATTVLGWSRGSQEASAQTRTIGHDRIVSWESLPELNGDTCAFPASPVLSLAAASPRQAGSGAAAASQDRTRPSDATRASVAERQPLRVITDRYFGFAGIAVDPLRNEVVMAEENLSSLVVYDRLTNTPPTAASEPKRVIGGQAEHKAVTSLHYVSSVYIDPATGDLFGVSNDTMGWMPVFGRDAEGPLAVPKRKWDQPHTSFGVAADEEEQELFLTIQDDHAVVVVRKDARDADSPVRILQGSRTQLADPHGIALDPTRSEIFVSNWGISNERPPLTEGGGGGGSYHQVGHVIDHVGHSKELVRLLLQRTLRLAPSTSSVC